LTDYVELLELEQFYGCLDYLENLEKSVELQIGCGNVRINDKK